MAKVLQYTNPAKAIRDHVDSEDKNTVTIRDSIGREQKPIFINESGLYSLILSSKLPTAKKSKLPLAVLKLFKQINCVNRGNQYTGGKSAIGTFGITQEELAARLGIDINTQVAEVQIALLAKYSLQMKNTWQTDYGTGKTVWD